jgi:hypothetical protein
MRIRARSLALLCAAVIQAQTGYKAPPGSKAPKVESCGFGGSIHDCHCSERVEKIRAADIGTCGDVKDSKQRDACVRKALAGHNHCDIAERSTIWDRDSDGLYPPDGHGDHVSSGMGEYCKRACAKHRCQCSEQTCNFGMTEQEIKDANAR